VSADIVEIYVERTELETIADFVRERASQGVGLNFEIRALIDGSKELRIQPASGGITLVVEQDAE
jgi:hypothetical protein